MAMHIGIGNFSGAIASNIYRAKDSPRFRVGRESHFVFCHRGQIKVTICLSPNVDGVELMFVGMGFVVVPAIVLLYRRINAQRDAAAKEAADRGETNKYTNQQLREMGDRAPDFRYTL